MNRLDKKFSELKIKGEKALVGFVAAGDPTLRDSLRLITAMCRAGLDILELGI
ncbi:MAG: tryptophan synthase subunit alpha, partial [Syntrophaceae bacterium]|nr:tryptophan synthase subunit alpha [Syntrophaceae bacterium]